MELFLLLAFLALGARDDFVLGSLTPPLARSASEGRNDILPPGEDPEARVPIGEEIDARELEDLAWNTGTGSSAAPSLPSECPGQNPRPGRQLDFTARVKESRAPDQTPAVPGLRPVGTLIRGVWNPSPWIGAGARYELDAGEQIDEGFFVGYLTAHFAPFCADLVLGDFVVAAGMGLLQGGGARYRTDPEEDFAALRRVAGQIRPSLASEGSSFCRGIGLNLRRIVGATTLQASLFASSLNLRGTRASDGGVGSFSSDLGEPDGRESIHVIRERSAGFRIRAGMADLFTAGCSGMLARFDAPLSSRWSADMSRSGLAGLSLDAAIRFGDVGIAGEWSLGAGGDQAIAAALSLDYEGALHFHALFRDYGHGRISRHASRPGVRQTAGSESGLQVNWTVPIGASVRVSGVLDRYRVALGQEDAPPIGDGSELLGVLSIAIPGAPEFQLQARRRVRDELAESLDSCGRELLQVSERRQIWFRGSLALPLGRQTWAKARFDCTSLRSGSGHTPGRGESLSIEITWALVEKLAVTGRVTVFGTGSYDSRLYEGGGGLPGEFSILPLYGDGNRLALIVRWHVGTHVTLHARYSSMFREAAGSGSEWRSRVDQRELSIQTAVRM